MANGRMAHSNSESQAEAEAVDEDERLISAAKEDVEAFGRLYDKYYKDIFRYIYRRTSDMALTEDLTSDTFLSAFKHIRRYKWRRIPFNAWLHRIATNEIRLHHQKQKRTSAINLEIASSSASESLTTVAEDAALHEAIRKLKPIHQTVIILRFFQDMTIPEISEMIGEREGTVKSRLHRGMEQLRKILMRQGDSIRQSQREKVGREYE